MRRRAMGKRKGRPVHGWLILDKPAGLSSAAAVGQVKRLFGAAKLGHAGTLDPLASGILPLAFGEATKTVAYVMDGAKRYRFEISFGEARSTEDAEGEVTATSDVRPDDAAISAVLPRFIGTILQRPPAFSALKIGGQRAYDLARAGAAPDMIERPVEISSLTLAARPDPGHAIFEVACGKGTYIRSLGRDIALALGTVGYISMLRRTAVGRFSEAESISLDSLTGSEHGPATSECLNGRLLPILTALDDIPALAVTEAEAELIRNGRTIEFGEDRTPSTYPLRRSDVVCAVCGDRPVALADYSDRRLRPVRVFNL